MVGVRIPLSLRGSSIGKKLYSMYNVHAFACAQLEHKSKSPAINLQLSSKARADQATAFCMLKKIISSIRYLARQRLALRGHEHDEGNFQELLHVREEEQRGQFWAVQNELLELMAHSIIRTICVDIRKAGSFATTVDGTTYIMYKSKHQLLCTEQWHNRGSTISHAT